MNIRMGNFGQAKSCEDKEVDGSPEAGMMPYRAPEMMGATPKVSRAADIYSLGVIFCESLYLDKTGTERSVGIGALDVEDGHIPDGVCQQHWFDFENAGQRPHKTGHLHRAFSLKSLNTRLIGAANDESVSMPSA